MELLDGSPQEQILDYKRLPWMQPLKKLELVSVLAYAGALPISVTLSWVLLIVGIITSFLLGLAEGFKLAANLRLLKAPLAIPLLLFGLVVFASGFFAGGIKEAVLSVSSLRALAVYFWSYLIFSRNRKLVLYVVQVLLVVGSIAGLWGTIQQVANFHPFGYHYLQGTGFFGGPMAFAGQMQILSMLALCFLFSKTYKEFVSGLKISWVFYLITILNCFGVLFASERSAWVGFMVAAPIIAFVWSWKNFIKSAAGLILLGIGCFEFVP